MGRFALVALTSVLLGACSLGPKSIINEIEVQFSGYNGDGQALYDSVAIERLIDEVSLRKAGLGKDDAEAVAAGDELVTARLQADSKTSLKLTQAELMADSVSYSLDKVSELTNGDQVILTIKTSSKESPVKEETKTLTVSGLKDYQIVAIEDLIDLKQLSLEGFNGYGKLRVADPLFFDKVKVETDSQTLRNGDKIPLTLTDNYKAELLEDGKKPDKDSLDYEVKDLKELTDIPNLADGLSKNDAYAKSGHKNTSYRTYQLEPQKHFVRYTYGYDESARGKVALLTVYKITTKWSGSTEVDYKYYGYEAFVRADGTVDWEAADQIDWFGFYNQSKDYEGLLAQLETAGYKVYEAGKTAGAQPGLSTSSDKSNASSSKDESKQENTSSTSQEETKSSQREAAEPSVPSRDEAIAIADRVLGDYRSAINKAMAEQDTSDLEAVFSSGSETHQYVVNQVLPTLWADGVAGYDSTTTSTQVTAVTADKISAHITFSTVTRYKNGTTTGPASNERDYEFVREGDDWKLSWFSR